MTIGKRVGIGTPLWLVTLGVGAQASPRYAPAGLLVQRGSVRVMIDGGPGAAPSGTLAAWLVTDMRSELMPRIRELAGAKSLKPYAGPFRAKGLVIECLPVIHTSHPAFGYLIRACGLRVAWAPEFFEFPAWAGGVALMFAEAAGWNRPIYFRGGVGGHLDALAVAETACRRGVRRLVFAHIGRPTLRAIDQGKTPPFGEIGADGRRYILGGRARVSPGSRLRTCELSSRRTTSRLAPPSCSCTGGTQDGAGHAPKVARCDRRHGGSRDSGTHR